MEKEGVLTKYLIDTFWIFYEDDVSDDGHMHWLPCFDFPFSYTHMTQIQSLLSVQTAFTLRSATGSTLSPTLRGWHEQNGVNSHLQVQQTLILQFHNPILKINIVVSVKAELITWRHYFYRAIKTYLKLKTRIKLVIITLKQKYLYVQYKVRVPDFHIVYN